MNFQVSRYLAVVLFLLLTPRVLSAQGSTLSGAVTTYAGVDDNPGGSQQSSRFLELRPHLRFRQERRRGFWSLDYQSTARQFTDVSVEQGLDHHLLFDTGVVFSKRAALNFNQRFVYATNAFERIMDERPGEGTPGSVLFGTNSSLVGLEQRFALASSHLSFHYLLGPHSRLTFGADYYREDLEAERLFDRDTRNFRAEYEKQYARNKTLSAIYSMQLFRTPAASTRVRTHSLLFTHSYELRPGTSLSVFGGPQYSRVQGYRTVLRRFFFFAFPSQVFINEPDISFALGLLFSHRVNDRTWVEFSVSRRVSDGSEFSSTVIQNSARLNFRHQLTHRLSTSVSAYIADNRALADLSSIPSLRTYGGSAAIRYALTRGLGLTARYESFRYRTLPEELRPYASRTRVALGLDYSFGPVRLRR